MELSMLKILGIIAVVLLIAIAGILAYAASKPDSFRVERTRDIKASPERIFALINDLRGWGAWSPYEKGDPDMQRSFSGADSGKGAVYQWDGNKNVGKGRMEMVDITPPSRIVIKLDFIKPFEGHNTAEFTMVPRGDMTRVTWAMFGPAPFISKVMQVFMNFDKMIGKDFEDGLNNLKAVAER
jgi:uncharacterized protein YndB with AHSA1/START domain